MWTSTKPGRAIPPPAQAPLLPAPGVALGAEAWPGDPTAPLAHAVAGYRHALPLRVQRGWVIRQGGPSEQVVARAAASYADVPENRDHAEITITVHPAVRGLGL